VVGGTDMAPFDSGSSASRLTFVEGLAAQRAAAQLRTRLCALAAEYVGCPPEQVIMTAEGFTDGRSTVPLGELARRAIAPHQPMLETGTFTSPTLSEAPSFAALVAEVHVDRETGTLTVRKLTGVFDVGTVLNPQGVDGQLRGGLIQSLGAALMEDIGLDAEGRVATASLGDYKLPCAQDIPPLQMELITDAPGDGPYGAKAVGELTNALVPPAITNAVYAAVGVRICGLPITAEKIFRALHT